MLKDLMNEEFEQWFSSMMHSAYVNSQIVQGKKYNTRIYMDVVIESKDYLRKKFRSALMNDMTRTLHEKDSEVIAKNVEEIIKAKSKDW